MKGTSEGGGYWKCNVLFEGGLTNAYKLRTGGEGGQKIQKKKRTYFVHGPQDKS